jgi:hypothetical protein
MYNMPDISAILDQPKEGRGIQRTQGLMSKVADEPTQARPQSPNDIIASHIQRYRQDVEDFSTTAALEEDAPPPNPVDTSYRPRRRDEGGDPQSLTQQASDLLMDEGFEAKLSEMQEKYPGLTRQELFRTIKGESAFNPTATNPNGATGLFQIMPQVAEELGTTTEQILKMSPAQQLDLYDRYLSRWGYTGEASLGVMQSAPAYANASPETVVYEEGSAAWRQNPGWRPRGGGDITVASINNYYRRQ